ncbi:LCP family protein [Bacillus sp. V5-8f]|uniref:LCP family protein n=1 Tax=Bacillus sp. V5-8f TaxID=2053044 RepID=UPI000C78CCB9|nr:LCP family protein [Bacillus sp. V5-8f]PLT35718.1 transcriptional regulator [Bacillus sp. V5-8f]
MAKTTRLKRTKKKKNNWKLFFLTLLLFILGGTGYWAYDILTSSQEASKKIYEAYEPSHRDEDIRISKEPFSVLLAGIDNQGGARRADMLMLVTVNPKTEQVFMLSIPRDSRVYVPEKGYKTKINHTYGYKGGIKSTIEVTEELLDVPIDYFVTTNFQGFRDIVDTLGGITVDVPFTFREVMTGGKYKTFYKGPMELNGNEALAYVRMRKKDPKGDLGRNERQQQVIKEIIGKSTSFGSIIKIDDVMNDLGENVKTNIRPSRMLEFVRLYQNIKDGQIENLKLEGNSRTIRGVSYYIPSETSIEDNATMMKRSLSGEKIDIEQEQNSTVTKSSH